MTMKCPYRNFEKCIVENCPSCNYKETKQEVIVGKYPNYMSVKEAMEIGVAWKKIETTYEFVSCKLIESGATPIPQKKETINNRTSVIVNRSIF